MYLLTELAALASDFDQLTLRRVGGLTLARQRGSVAELATLCQGWGRQLLPCTRFQPAAPRHRLPRGPGFSTHGTLAGTGTDVRRACRTPDGRRLEARVVESARGVNSEVVGNF